LISWLRASLSEVEITDETLALDLIDEVGPDGHFTDTDHTLAHFRGRWYPTLIERYDYQTWVARGGQDLGQRAAARVDEILDRYQHEPLPTAIRKQLRDIVQRATARYAD
jgi:trimethylamine--corrinoid protein Co-methyltransferase